VTLEYIGWAVTSAGSASLRSDERFREVLNGRILYSAMALIGVGLAAGLSDDVRWVAIALLTASVVNGMYIAMRARVLSSG